MGRRNESIGIRYSREEGVPPVDSLGVLRVVSQPTCTRPRVNFARRDRVVLEKECPMPEFLMRMTPNQSRGTLCIPRTEPTSNLSQNRAARTNLEFSLRPLEFATVAIVTVFPILRKRCSLMAL
jgi:hypothetical protein